MGLYLLLLVLGFVLLIKGADWLVEGASALAGKFGFSDLAIGLTIVAFGTSAPELVVNVYASWEGHQGIVLGNIIGSNIFNLFAILGVAGLIIPLAVQSSTVWKEIPLSLLAVLVLFLLANDARITGAFPDLLGYGDALILFLFFAAFLFYVYRQLSTDGISKGSEVVLSGPKMVLFIAGGLAGLIGGGQLVVRNAVNIAEMYHLEERIIGLTILAAGTSLPELATSVMAALKKKSDIAVGNVIGSNIFNIFLILSASAFVHPVSYATDFNFHLFFLGGGTVFLFLCMFIGKRKRLDRWQSATLLIAFVLYTFYLINTPS